MVQIRTRKKFLAAVKACMAIFWPNSGFKGRTFVSSGFSTEGLLISTSAVPHCKMTNQDPQTVAQWTTACNHFRAVQTVKSPELALHIEVILHIMKKREDWTFQGNVVKNEAGWGQTHLGVLGCHVSGTWSEHWPHPPEQKASPSCTYHWEPASPSTTQPTAQMVPDVEPYSILPSFQQDQEQHQSFHSSYTAYGAARPQHSPEHFGNRQQAPLGQQSPTIGKGRRHY